MIRISTILPVEWNKEIKTRGHRKIESVNKISHTCVPKRVKNGEGIEMKQTS